MLNERIGPETARFAVLGQSLPHTWSPYIHNSLFDAAGLDAVYLPVTVPPERLGSVTDVFRSCFSGFNVTIPYKEKILPFLDDIDEAAQVCGAVNTVEIRNGRMIGHITDGLGMLRAIEERGVETHQADVLILGGGGAARVAGYAFLSRGGRVTFAVRDAQKGNPLADCAEAHDILINCTPVGMYPHVDACPVSADVIARCGAVFDAVYNPRETRLLTLARQNGLPAIEGLGMLFYQAVEAQKFWFGDRVASKAEQSRIYSELQTRL